MKKKLITVCVALLILALLSACNSQESSSKKEMSGYIHENGSAEVILADEKTASYSGDYYSVETSQNRKNIALLGKNGDLSIAQGTETQCIDQEVQAVKLLGNGLLLYSKLKYNGRLYAPIDTYTFDVVMNGQEIFELYDYATGQITELGTDLKYTSDISTRNILFAAPSSNGQYILKLFSVGKETPVVLLQSENALSPLGISSDGKIYVWAEEHDSQYYIYLYANNETFELFSCADVKDYNVNVSFAANNKHILVACTGSDVLATWTDKTGVSLYNLPSPLHSCDIYTTSGLLSQYQKDAPATIYVLADNLEDDGITSSIYAISNSGRQTKIANKILDFEIRGKSLYYTDSTGNLYYANLSGNVIKNEAQVDTAICDFSVSPNGNKVAYIKHSTNENRALLFISEKASTPFLINDNVYDRNIMGYHSMVAKFSLNSNKLYYFSNPVEISDSTEYDSWIGSNYLAELMQFNISENDSTQIAENAFTELISENSDGFCGDGGIWYCKYKTTSDEKHICDLVFWNGKESKVIAIDIIK